MTVIDKVFTALKNNAGNSMTTMEIVEAIGDGTTREQVNSALWRLRTEQDLIKQVKTGIHKYLGPTERASNGVIAINAGSVSDPIAEDETAQDKFFTQVGTAKNGDLLITRDSDGAAFRATPL